MEAHEPGPPDCHFHICTSPPSVRYVEVGTVDLSPGIGDSNWTNDLGLFRLRIRPHICEAGGDAAIAWANGKGLYVQATALKLESPPPPAAKVTAPPPQSPVVQPVLAAPGVPFG